MFVYIDYLRLLTFVGSLILAVTVNGALLQQPSVPESVTRIDAIKKAGVLRVGVLSNPPWLVENTSGSGDRWAGPAWLLANEYARLLDVTLQAVPVSHETKIPVLASNQVDMTISPLSVTPERQKVVDFVSYSKTALCVFGRADNPNVASAKTIDEFNHPDITIAYYTGGGEENWVRKRFPKANLRGVSTAGTAAPIEEITAGRADITPVNRVPWLAISRKVNGLKVLPTANNCQDSTEMTTSIALAIDKNQLDFLNWLIVVSEHMQDELAAEEKFVIDTMYKQTSVNENSRVLNLDFSSLLGISQYLLGGVGITLALSLATILSSLLLGGALGLGRVYGPKSLRIIITFYNDSMRAIPVLVILVWFYFGVPILTGISFHPFWAAYIALTLHITAYVAEIVRAGIESVRPGQVQAGLALGMSNAQVVRKILLPQAVVRMLPAFGSVLSITIKDTAIAAVIAVPELMNRAETIAGQNFHPAEIFTVTMLIFFLILFPCTRIIDLLYVRVAHLGRS